MKRNKKEIELVNEWLSFAKESLLSAQAIINEDFAPFHTVCFMCQGSAEKYLKAFLIWNGWELENIHNLSELISYCSRYDIDFQKLYQEAEMLNKYIVAGRYPGDLPVEGISKSEAEEAIEAAEKIEKFTIERINFEEENKK